MARLPNDNTAVRQRSPADPLPFGVAAHDACAQEAPLAAREDGVFNPKINFGWAVLLAVFRTTYFAYSLWCLLFPVAVCGLVYALWTNASSVPDLVHMTVWSLVVAFLGGASIIIALVYGRRTPGDPDPLQSGFMSWFGTLRLFWNTTPGPMVKLGLPSGFMVENPAAYRIGGVQTREILNALQPGDILLRAYDGYMDGAFIKQSSTCSQNGYRPGWFTHAALYVGPINDADRARVPSAPVDFRDNPEYVTEGPQMVVHSMAMGVHTEDILTWCRCDYLAILRVKQTIAKTREVNVARRPNLIPRESEIISATLKYKLRKNLYIDRDDAIRAARMSAFEKIGEPYDFECIVTDKFTRFSCAEFVYYCYRSIHDALGLEAKVHALYPFGKLARTFSIMKRVTVTPDDYFDLAASGNLELVWADDVTRAKHRISAAPVERAA